MKVQVILIMLILSINATLPGNTNSIKFANNWTINYSIQSGMIYVEAIGTNKGAIAIGFGGSEMTSVDVAHFYYDSTVKFADRSYIHPPPEVNDLPQVLEDTKRTPPGTDDVNDNGSTFNENTGQWKASFWRKLDTNDQYDNVIVEGKDIQVVIAVFADQVWGNEHTSTSIKVIQPSSQLLSSSAYLISHTVFIATLFVFLFF